MMMNWIWYLKYMLTYQYEVSNRAQQRRIPQLTNIRMKGAIALLIFGNIIHGLEGTAPNAQSAGSLGIMLF